MSPVPLAKPPWTGLGKRLESMVRKALYDHRMLEGVDNLAVALSGGKDSLSMLFLLHAIAGKGFPDISLHAIHVHGTFSCGAGVNVNELKTICDALEINLITKTTEQSKKHLACYSCSRTRRSLLFEAAKQVDATTIAFGHHRDDHAQTVLMNLLHKAEFAGMLPKLKMETFGVTLIRPLIYITEKELQRFAEANHFAKIVCRCPVGQHSYRKKVDDLLKEIEVLYPHARQNIARAGHLYGSDKARRP
ncbi:MAG: tRNA 2-thiocytidine biosynthesis TtcA family protein [Waddliaceae bacterium]